jgi:mannosyltransferase OCH1-like enzyme
MRAAMEATMKMNPEFDYFLFSDADCRKLIQDNFDASVVKAFDCLKPGAYKSDLWRLCVLYTHGGVYMDIKMKTAVPFKPVIEEGGAFFVKDRNVYGKTYGIWNGFIISPPKVPLFKACIDEIVNHVETKFYGTNNLEISGPHLLGRILEQSYPDQKQYIRGIVKDTGNNSVKIDTLPGGSPLLTQYDGYRNELNRSEASEHYSKAWDARTVYTC